MIENGLLYVSAPYQDEVDSGRLILRDGSTATIRVAKAADHVKLGSFFERLSPESRQQRFFSVSSSDTFFDRRVVRWFGSAPRC